MTRLGPPARSRRGRRPAGDRRQSADPYRSPGWSPSPTGVMPGLAWPADGTSSSAQMVQARLPWVALAASAPGTTTSVWLTSSPPGWRPRRGGWETRPSVPPSATRSNPPSSPIRCAGPTAGSSSVQAGGPLPASASAGSTATSRFVDVVATDQPPTPDGIAAVAAGVLPGFALFQPLCLRVDAPQTSSSTASLDDDPSLRPGPLGGRPAHRGRPRVGAARQAARPRPTPTTSRCGPASLSSSPERAAAIYCPALRNDPSLGHPRTPTRSPSARRRGCSSKCSSDRRPPSGVVAAIEAGRPRR